MSSEPPENAGESANFLAFDKTNDGNNRGGYRQNFQYRPYNRHQNNYRNKNIRRNQLQSYQQFGAPQNDDDPQFSPANFSSPVHHHHQRFDNGGGGGGGGGFRHRPNHMNQQFQHRRNFVPFNRFGGGGGGGGHSNHHQKSAAVPIQQYFHKSMIEDPWADCHQFNGTNDSASGTTNDPPSSATSELSAET